MVKKLLLGFILLFDDCLYAKTPLVIPITDFSNAQLADWQHKEFKGKTQYKIVRLGKLHVLQAQSHGTASGLVKKQKIDLTKTPYLNWRWRIENRLGNFNEQTKSGDDYAARIYIVISGGMFFWKTKAINYVWSANSEKGAIWPNAFAGKHAMMIAVRSAQDPIKTWVTEKRNIASDLNEIYGEDFQYSDAIAIMTDTDNTNSRATAYYGDIYFSAN